ncbi:MAG: hypothetical protein IPG75_16795 [Gemmatimonadetes bacterium]|nr:hypothetical protein [Gemmatimonadota bacterium]
MPLGRTATMVSWACQLTAAVILGQTLFFKFTGAPESRTSSAPSASSPGVASGTAVAEARRGGIAAVCPRRRSSARCWRRPDGRRADEPPHPAWHRGSGDHGLLFRLALTVMVAALVVVALRRRELPLVEERF